MINREKFIEGRFKMVLKLSHSLSFFEKLWFIYSQRVHKKLINEHANFYLKPNDIISHRPTLFGYHESFIEKLIEKTSEDYPHFFLDLGANIGLTSSLVGNSFQRVDCVEPNELVFNILKTNLAINLSTDNYHCHMIGLGRKDETLNLLVPKDNFGGAFIEESNDIVFTKKAALSEDFIEVQVKVINAEKWLVKYFSTMERHCLTKGVVKIDVEGYEGIIFESLIASLPKNFELLVIMENWFEHFPIKKFTSSNHNLSWYYFRKKKRLLHSIPFKLLGLSSSYRHELEELTEFCKNPHDIVCHLSAI